MGRFSETTITLNDRYWPIPTAPDTHRHGGYGASRGYFVIYFKLFGIADAS